MHAFSTATYAAVGEEAPTWEIGARADASVVVSEEREAGMWLQPRVTIIAGHGHVHPSDIAPR